jgi:hypothetical protein
MAQQPTLTQNEIDDRETWDTNHLLRHILTELEALNARMDETLLLKVPKSVEVTIK